MPSAALAAAVQPTTTDVDQQPAPRTPVGLLNSPDMVQQIAESLPRGMDPGAFKRHAITLVKQTPKLMECEATSVAQGIVRGAALGLDPDPALGQMWLVPRRTKIVEGGRERWAEVATFQVGYRGHLELAMRTGRFAKIEVKPVHREDFFEARLGSAGGLRHEPDWFGDRGPVIGWYAYALQKDGTESFEVLSVADAERHRDAFAPKKRDGQVYGPWVDHFDAMAQKTVFLKLAKWLPKSVEQSSAMEFDGQAVLAPLGGQVRPQDVIEATHTPDAEAERPALAAAADPETGEVLPPAEAETSGDDRSSPASAAEHGDPIEAAGAEPVSDEVRAKQRKMFARTAKIWDGEDRQGQEARRKGLLLLITNGRTDSSSELSDEEWRDLDDSLELLELKSNELHLDSHGTWVLKPIPAGRARRSTTTTKES
ncbi:recombinase RecT [Aquihabitans sp. G128]|uniref:recombinase RecT n=1 Tax=Aquihabitans sp. G128 TaxID=2849779 RepID=UPI001C22D92B|nr:recombinase RecT [Aquihabitans sp. G128]QXC59354.1 recombinase RecT [Aquihabitans sp. G128]